MDAVEKELEVNGLPFWPYFPLSPLFYEHPTYKMAPVPHVLKLRPLHDVLPFP